MSLSFQTLSYAIAYRWCSYRLWAYPRRSVDNSPLSFSSSALLEPVLEPGCAFWIVVVFSLICLPLVASSFVLFSSHIFGFECRPRRLSMISMPGEGNILGPLESLLLRFRHRIILLCRLGGWRMFVLLAYHREESLLRVLITFFTLPLMSLRRMYTICLMFL